jgi:type IV pilus assembly protein PilC
MEFIYTGIDTKGVRQRGKIDASNEKEIVEFLQKSAITPISISKTNTNKDDLLSFLKNVTENDIVIFTRQLSSMVLTGLTLIESLTILKEQINKPKMQLVINQLIADVSEGLPFSKALAKNPKIFPEIYVSLIEAAETGGLLDKVLQRLADNMEKSEDLKKRVRSALFYPAIVVTGVVVVLAIMNIFVIPQLGRMYENLNIELPLTTQIVLGISQLFTAGFPFISVALIGLYFLFNRFSKTEKGIQTIDNIKLKLPVFGDIFMLSTLDEITRTLSILISSGTSIIQSLNIASRVASNHKYKVAVRNSSALVEKGVSLSQAFQNQNIFPPILIQMIRVGESTGRIDDSLLKISEYFERDLDVKVKTLTTAIEPILIVVLGVSVAFLILSVITPIYSLISQIQ